MLSTTTSDSDARERLGLWLNNMLTSRRWSCKTKTLQWKMHPLCSTRTTEFEDTDTTNPLPCNESAKTLKCLDAQSGRYLYQLALSEQRTDSPMSVSTENGMRSPAPRAQGCNTGVCQKAKEVKLPVPKLDNILPTPAASLFKISGVSETAWEKRIADGRQEEVAMTLYKEYKKAGLLDAVKDGNIFRLSPLFIEEMMGFPLMWTTLPFLSKNEKTETPSL